MDLLATAALASTSASAYHLDFNEFAVEQDEGPLVPAAPPPAAPSSEQAREVQARLALLVSEVENTERHLRAAMYRGGAGVLVDADLDVALRMPRGAVERRKGRLRFVTGRTQVVSPTSEELAHLRLGDEPDGR